MDWGDEPRKKIGSLMKARRDSGAPEQLNHLQPRPIHAHTDSSVYHTYHVAYT